jgi:hypothetical protein
MLRDFFPVARSRKATTLIILLAAFTSAVASWAVPVQFPSAGLDSSWAQALVDATDNARVFGKDIIFTYGPLHQAATAQFSDNLAPLIFSRLFFSAAWFVIQLSIGMLFGLQAAASVALAATISAGQNGDANFYLLSLVGIFALTAIGLHSPGYLSDQRVFLSTIFLSSFLLATLVKLSYLGAFIPIFLLAMGLQLIEVWENRDTRSISRLALLLFCPFLMLCMAWSLTSGWSPRDLYGYYFGKNLEIIKGYTDAMSYEPSFNSALLIIIFLFTFLVLFLFVCTQFLGISDKSGFIAIATNPRHKLTLICLVLLAWVIFKSSFVRDDSDHTRLVAIWIMSLYFMIIGFSSRNLKKSVSENKGEYVALSLILTFVLSSVFGILSGYRLSEGIALKYIRGFFDSFMLLSSDGRTKLALQRNNALGNIRRTGDEYKIPKGASADVIPWHISYVLANELKYTPRPIPQSYTVYTRILQDINKQFFVTPQSSPDWLIIDIKDIDNRLPIGLDSPVLRSIINSYKFSHSGSKGSLVFKKQENALRKARIRAIKCKKIARRNLNWHRFTTLSWKSKALPLSPDDTGMVVFDAHLKGSLSRSIISSFYRPFPVTIEYLNKAGNVLATYRFIPQASREMIIYPILASNEDFLEFMQSNGSVDNDLNNRVDSFRFVTRNIGIPFSRSQYKLSSHCGNAWQ